MKLLRGKKSNSSQENGWNRDCGVEQIKPDSEREVSHAFYHM
jgi:hypothetical protein